MRRACYAGPQERCCCGPTKSVDDLSNARRWDHLCGQMLQSASLRLFGCVLLAGFSNMGTGRVALFAGL